jgi:lipopolysaccharide/colanic/teichoic acid biosynthesis glycosyltransferase/glycosyltransferase involved in cell wall biosynthesis
VLTTFPNYPSGNIPLEYRGHVMQQEVEEGIRIVRVWSYVSPNKGFLRRILAQLSFGCLAPFLGGLAVGRPDVIIVESPPLFDAIAGRIMAWLKHCPFIFTVSDLWPESAVQLGMLHNRILIKLAEWLEWSTYRQAGAVWALTEGIRDTLLKRGLSPEQVFRLTNGVDTFGFRPLPKAQARAELGWDDRFTVLYAGTHGIAQGLTSVLDAAEQLANHAGIHFFLVGDGAVKEDLVADAQRRNLRNVTFLDPQPHNWMPLFLAGADVCLVPLRKLSLFEGAVPSKMYEAMACARPIVLSVQGEARRMAEQEAGAALAVEPENADALVSAILFLREHPEVVEALGWRGRKFVEKRFDREQLTAELEKRIARLLEKKGCASLAPAAISIGEGAQRDISVVPAAAVYESGSGKIPMDHIGDQWSIAFSREQFASPLYLCWSKAIDLAFGICGLAILCILLPIVALLIYLDSPGQVFFIQERAGYRGRTFRMLKLRSMSPGAECAEGGAWTSKGDARVTRMGRLLRATHLDELPQVLNIVRGDMSLIGPRPERPQYVTELARSDPLYSYRLSVRPGLTGWAQVKYGYGCSKQDELVKLQYDLFYIKHRSFLLDILILLKTVREVVLCHGT